MTETNRSKTCEYCDFVCIGNARLQRHLFNFHSEELK